MKKYEIWYKSGRDSDTAQFLDDALPYKCPICGASIDYILTHDNKEVSGTCENEDWEIWMQLPVELVEKLNKPLRASKINDRRKLDNFIEDKVKDALKATTEPPKTIFNDLEDNRVRGRKSTKEPRRATGVKLVVGDADGDSLRISELGEALDKILKRLDKLKNDDWWRLL